MSNMFKYKFLRLSEEERGQIKLKIYKLLKTKTKTKPSLLL